MLILFGTKGFSAATLSDAYNVLIGNGWTTKDALGFLGTSIAGTIAMNPSLAPTVAAGALSAYIVYKGAQLYDIYRDWKNLRTGIAMLNPVQFSQSMSVKTLVPGEYGWSSMGVFVRWIYPWHMVWQYHEKYNDNGLVVTSYSKELHFYGTKDECIHKINLWIQNELPKYKDAQGRSMFSSLLNAAYSNIVAGNNLYSVGYSREVVAALESGSGSAVDSTLGYRVNVDPASISEDGVQYLDDPDAFYNWFINNYMNGVNEGTFVTPTVEAYDEIRTQLESIIDQLNALVSSGGGVSEEALNQVKTEIVSVINTRLSSVDTQLSGLDTKLSDINTTLSGVDAQLSDINTTLSGVDTQLSDINTTLSGVDAQLSDIDTILTDVESDIESVKTSIDTLTDGISEAQEQQQGFWDRLMEWLDVSLFEKLRALLEELFVPTEEQWDELLDIEVPEYEKSFAAEVSFTSQSASIPMSLFGSSVDLSDYIDDYASGLRSFMNIFVCGIAAIFVIRAFRVHLNID